MMLEDTEAADDTRCYKEAGEDNSNCRATKDVSATAYATVIKEHDARACSLPTQVAHDL